MRENLKKTKIFTHIGQLLQSADQAYSSDISFEAENAIVDLYRHRFVLHLKLNDFICTCIPF